MSDAWPQESVARASRVAIHNSALTRPESHFFRPLTFGPTFISPQVANKLTNTGCASNFALTRS
jgi:hypothetical protein